MFRKQALWVTMMLLVVSSVDAAHSIHDFVAHNDLERVSQLLKEHATSVDQANRYDERPLHLAQTPEMIELLIRRGADVNIENHFGDSPLLQAVYRGDHGLVELLIERGANIDHKNRFGDTPLREAARRDLIVMVQILVDRGANLNMQNRHGETVLHAAVRRGNHSMVRVLVAGGAGVDIEDEDGYSPIDLAVGYNMKKELTVQKRRR